MSGNVGNWIDRYSGHVFSEATAGNKPVISSIGPSGKAVVTFGGTRRLLSDTTYTSVSTETYFVVTKINTSVSLSLSPLLGSLATGSNWQIYHTQTAGAIAQLNWATENTNPGTQALRNVIDINTGSNFKLLTARRSVASNMIEFRENGEQMFLDTHTSGTADIQLRLGANRVGNFGNVTFGEILRYNRWLTDSEVTQMETYLNNKWGLYSTPTLLAEDDFIPYMRRYIYATGTSTSASLPATQANYLRLYGDSYAAGYALKTDLGADSKVFTNAFLYDWANRAGVSASAQTYDARTWIQLDETSVSGINMNYSGALSGDDSEFCGIEAPIAITLTSATGLNTYILKYGKSGSQAANGVADTWQPVPTSVSGLQELFLKFRRYHFEGLQKLFFNSNIRVKDRGTIFCLGTNDGQTQSDVDALPANLRTIAETNYRLPRASYSPLILPSSFSTSPVYQYQASLSGQRFAPVRRGPLRQQRGR